MAGLGSAPIEWLALLCMAACLTLASLAGVGFSRLYAWREDAEKTGLDVVFGVAIGTLAFGVLGVIAVYLWPGLPSVLHLLAVIVVLVVWTSIRARSVLQRLRTLTSGWRPGYGTLVFFAFGLMMVLEITLAPLAQNDPLEYATAARVMGETGRLQSYPAIVPTDYSSGFYGPWTHPPLYTVLIYLSNTVEGVEGTSRAMRLISPWCFFCAAACVLSLGRQRSKGTGTLAALLFLSTPLLFLGAAGAQIDPLPVLGLSAILIAIVGLDRSARGWSLAAGAAVGFALWTHSEAIIGGALAGAALLLVLWGGRRNNPRQHVIRSLCWVGVTAALISLWPYLRNVYLFGSPVSDSPIVYLLPQLRFDLYFEMQRGLGSTLESVQYGLLKGLFAPESFGLVFWVALFALPLAWRAMRRVLAGCEDSGFWDEVVACSLIVCAVYMVLIGVTLAAGVHVMVRNDRYLLLCAPCAAVLAATGVCSGESSGARLVSLAASVSKILLVASLIMFLALYVRQGALRSARISWDERSQLAGVAQFSPSLFLSSQVSPDAVVLSLRPADMYYSRRRMISYLDPRLRAFYEGGPDPSVALDHLDRLGITHVQVPDYMLPPIYRTPLMELLASETGFRLAADFGAYQVYERDPKSDRQATERRKIASVPVSWPWQSETRIVLGGPRSRLQYVLWREPYLIEGRSTGGTNGAWFSRQRRVVLKSPPMLIPKGVPDCGASSGRELVAGVSLQGRAHAYFVAELSNHVQPPVSRLLGDASFDAVLTEQRITRRIQLPPDVDSVVLSLAHEGTSWMRIKDVTVQVACVD